MSVSRFRNVVKINKLSTDHGLLVVSVHAGDAIEGPFIIHRATRERVDADDDVPLVIGVADKLEFDDASVVEFVRARWHGRDMWATKSAARDIARGVA